MMNSRVGRQIEYAERHGFWYMIANGQVCFDHTDCPGVDLVDLEEATV